MHGVSSRDDYVGKNSIIPTEIIEMQGKRREKQHLCKAETSLPVRFPSDKQYSSFPVRIPSDNDIGSTF